MRIFRVILSLAAVVWMAAACAASPAAKQPATEPPTTATDAPPPSAAPQQPTGAGASSPAPTRTFTVSATPERETMPASPASPLPQDPALAGLANQAIQDLAGRLSLPADQIEFVQLEPVVWPDGSMGCPQPGMLYTQMQVEGYRIRLQAGGQVYEYHGGGNRAPFLCENKLQ